MHYLHGNWILQLSSVLPFLTYLVTQTLGLCGPNSPYANLFTYKEYTYLFPWTQQKSKETLSIFSIKCLSGNTWSKTFLPWLSLYCSLIAFSLLFFSPPFVLWEILSCAKKMVKENFLPWVPAYAFILGGDTILGLRESLLLIQSTSCIEGLLEASVKSGKRFIISLSEAESGSW